MIGADELRTLLDEPTTPRIRLELGKVRARGKANCIPVLLGYLNAAKIVLPNPGVLRMASYVGAGLLKGLLQELLMGAMFGPCGCFLVLGCCEVLALILWCCRVRSPVAISERAAPYALAVAVCFFTGRLSLKLCFDVWFTVRLRRIPTWSELPNTLMERPQLLLEMRTVRFVQKTVSSITRRQQSAITEHVCQMCATRITLHRDKDLGVCYYWCRNCRRPYDDGRGWRRVESVVACVTNGWGRRFRVTKGSFRVSWFVQRSLFDFDSVEIIDADDEDVQRFYVQVLNDTDKLRRNRYPSIACTISPQCQLSENTLRNLKAIFGYVERVCA